MAASLLTDDLRSQVDIRLTTGVQDCILAMKQYGVDDVSRSSCSGAMQLSDVTS